MPRHPRFVRITHWVTTLAVFALFVSGLEIVLSHPRFYWGEVGNVNTTPLFTIPLPSSRATVPTGYSFVLADQNGWSRFLHFQSAWLVLAAGLVYVLLGLRSGHFRHHLVPGRADRRWHAWRATILDHMRFSPAAFGATSSYNALQRVSYLIVVFVLFPLLIWTGLAMAPAVTAVLPATATLLGGRQSARTFHLLVTIALVGFTIVHVTMVSLAGFPARVRAMLGATPETPR
ncbi:MAG: cytochrome b/b6 domain-containing protein [Gemmatimonadaceae bacterium]